MATRDARERQTGSHDAAAGRGAMAAPSEAGHGDVAAAAEAGRAGVAAPSDWPPQERISWFPVPDESDLDPRVAELVERQRQKLGAPNNVVRVHAWRPELMLRWLELFDYINKGPSGLTRVEREMIGVVVSAENRCIF